MKGTISRISARQYKNNDGRRTEWRNHPMGESIVYIDYDETIMENLENRRTRNWAFYKPLVAQALEAKGIHFSKLSYSRNAGCGMCPCSGGFILQDGDVGRDIFVEVV